MHVDRIRGHTIVADWIDATAIVVDLGANEGHFARAIRRRYGCRVVGIEANPNLAARANEGVGLTCFNYAIAAEAGTFEFGIDAENSEASSLTRQKSESVRRVQIRGVTLADFARETDLGRIDLLKVDIEGAELDMLSTAPPSLLAQIVQMSVEFHIFLHEDHRPKVAAVLDRMTAIGFHPVDFSRNYEDTLFINTQLRPLTSIDKALLLAQKYNSGIRRLAKRVAGVTRPPL